MNAKPPTPPSGVAYWVSEGDGYPNWTHRRMGEVLTEIQNLWTVYTTEALHNAAVDTDFYRHRMRVLYDLLHEDGR